jgi:DNA helicase-2/ATP-dependent DNA helicase PcrA
VAIDLIKGLNPPQSEAVTYTDGPLLILAGAGSGKTKVLTHRIANFVLNHHISPSRILGVTFTNKAAAEMKERLLNLMGEKIDLPFLGTFHSICVRILRVDGRHVGLEPSFTIYDPEDQKDIVKEAMKTLNIDLKEFNPNAVHWAISSAKNSLVGPKSYQNLVGDFFTENVAKIYPLYQSLLAERNAVDFDDLIMKTIELFTKHEDIKNKYVERFEQVLVDEYQDTNKAQYQLIKILAKPKQNITVVGDEDQSIYGWRGADIQNILSFEKDFKNPKIIKLEQNYRSTQIILDAAHAVINKNSERREKKLWSEKKEGPNITIYEAQNEVDEASFITAKIQEIIDLDTTSLKDIAVLYRANAQSRNIEEQFLKSRIPYRLVGGHRFYDRKEIKDALAYLRIIYNTADTLSLQRVINCPPRGIGPKTITEIIKCSKKLGIPIIDLISNVTLHDNYKTEIAEYLKTQPKSNQSDSDDAFSGLFDEEVNNEEPTERDEFFESLLNFQNEVTRNFDDSKILGSKNIISFGRILNSIKEEVESETNLSSFIKFLLEETKYYDHVNDKSSEGENRMENLKEFIGVASRYDNMPLNEAITKLLEDVSLIEDITEREKNGEGKDSVVLMTMHAAKGLEFKVVFIAGLEEGIFPHSRSLADNKEMEEERRLAYVGITRAKSDLFLIYTISRTYFGNTQSNIVSRFITDIPGHLVNFSSVMDRYDSLETKQQDFMESGEMEYIDVGDSVTHATFGRGKIVDIEGTMITVDFEKKGRTQLMAEYANLRKAK